jgi:hypothetical protein
MLSSLAKICPGMIPLIPPPSIERIRVSFVFGIALERLLVTNERFEDSNFPAKVVQKCIYVACYEMALGIDAVSLMAKDYASNTQKWWLNN